MAEQESQSSLAKKLAQKLGQQLTQAHQKHKDAPVETSGARLPPGIKNGLAQLSKAYISVYKEGENKGKDFFRASAIVKSPKSVIIDGREHKAEGLVTQHVIKLFDIPAKGNKAAISFDEQWFEFQNFFKWFGILAPEATDPSEIMEYYVAAMKLITDKSPGNDPPYITFETRSWTPPARPGEPPNTFIFEEWTGKGEPHDIEDTVATGINEGGSHDPNAPLLPPPGDSGLDMPPSNQAPIQAPAAEVKPDNRTPQELALVADSDQAGASPEGALAIQLLTSKALQAGIAMEVISNCQSWSEVASLCTPAAAPAEQAPVVGTIMKYARRAPDGAVMLGLDKKPVQPMPHEIVSVNSTNKTATLKNAATKQFVLGMDKKMIEVPWAHLESA